MQITTPQVTVTQAPAPLVPAAPAAIDITTIINTLMPLMMLVLVFALVIPMFREMTAALK